MCHPTRELHRGVLAGAWNSVYTAAIDVAHTLTSSSGGGTTGLPSVAKARQVAVYNSTQPVARSSVATTARLAIAAAADTSGGKTMKTPAQHTIAGRRRRGQSDKVGQWSIAKQRVHLHQSASSFSSSRFSSLPLLLALFSLTRSFTH